MNEIVTLGRATRFKTYKQGAKEKAFYADILIPTNKKGYSNTGLVIAVHLDVKTLSLLDIGSTTKLSEVLFDMSNLKLFLFITAFEYLPKQKEKSEYSYQRTIEDLNEIAKILAENKLL